MAKRKYLYLVKLKTTEDFYYQTDDNSVARYDKEIGTAILNQLPDEISKEKHIHEIIRSDNPEFKKILEKGLSKINMLNLEEKIAGLKIELERKKRNQDLIINTLNQLTKRK